MVASFHVVRAAAELILRGDKATVLGGICSQRKKKMYLQPWSRQKL